MARSSLYDGIAETPHLEHENILRSFIVSKRQRSGWTGKVHRRRLSPSTVAVSLHLPSTSFSIYRRCCLHILFPRSRLCHIRKLWLPPVESMPCGWSHTKSQRSFVHSKPPPSYSSNRVVVAFKFETSSSVGWGVQLCQSLAFAIPLLLCKLCSFLSG